MDIVTRRRFLVASGVAGASALAAGAVGVYTLTDLFDTARLADLRDGRTLVLITLYGGNDGLATVVPYADPAYRPARGDLAYSPDHVLRLDDATGLSPALTGFKKQYDAGRLAIVRGVGYPKPDRSHFRSMDIWQTAQPAQPGTTGWLGRWLDTTSGSDPRHAVTFESVLPPLLAGETKAGAAVTTGGVRLPNGYKPAMLAGFGQPGGDEPVLQARAARAYADLADLDRMIRELPGDTGTEEEAGERAATGTGGRSGLAAQLGLIARCVEAGVATRVYSASLGGFDLHADGREAQENQLRELDSAVSAFVDRMAKTELGRQVVVAVYSEFGRRVRANASDGTDHGTASDMFLLGGPVRGGQYGAAPDLGNLDDGDLKYTTDFRDVYASLLADVLGTDPAKVLDGWKSNMPGLFR